MLSSRTATNNTGGTGQVPIFITALDLGATPKIDGGFFAARFTAPCLNGHPRRGTSVRWPSALIAAIATLSTMASRIQLPLARSHRGGPLQLARPMGAAS